MKKVLVSDFIKMLESFKEEHGDFEIVIYKDGGIFDPSYYEYPTITEQSFQPYCIIEGRMLYPDEEEE